jgi:hypothetical protein
VVTGATLLPILGAAAPTHQGMMDPNLEFRVENGRFSNNWFDVQMGDVRIAVTTRGGPYQLEIMPLVDPRELPADTTTYIGFTVSDPGQYTIRLTGGTESTATLNVCQPGFC